MFDWGRKKPDSTAAGNSVENYSDMEEICRFCSGEAWHTHIVEKFRNWKMETGLFKKMLHMKEEEGYKKVLWRIENALIIDLGWFLKIVKHR